MKKSTIYLFPTIEDRSAAETALEVFLTVQNAAARNIMLSTLKSILTKYRLTKLNLEKCTIEPSTSGYVIIKPKKYITGRTCPSCGENLYALNSGVRILSICEGNTSDIVTYGCRCGEIFGKVETI
ncbi:MAG: hypothetical protein H0Z40_05380 [Desulfotomaculum sp.]|nr:hypothetical protein [Desulfotomaculum sp.]